MTIILRRAQPADADALPGIERSAAALFRTDPSLAWLADTPVTDTRQHLHAIQTQDVWVAEWPDGALAGFLSAEQVDNQLHILELSVGQHFQGQGLGRKLLLAAIEYSRERELDGLTLTTFRDLPWNAPFYQRFGFETLSAAETTPHLLAILGQEIDHGLPGERRCAMCLRLL